jgi:hypothetical protein
MERNIMLRITPSNAAYKLVEILGEVGEYPKYSMSLFGSQRIVLRRINLLLQEDQVSIQRPETDTAPALKVEFQKPLFVSVGDGHDKGIRLSKTGEEALEKFFPKTFEFYQESFNRNTATSAKRNRDRYHRCAETVALFKLAGIETLPTRLPELRRNGAPQDAPMQPSYYPSRSVKDGGDLAELDKTSYTRYCGIFFSGNTCYPVYNTRSAAMKWSASGELKAKYDISLVARLNGNIREVEDAILLGEAGIELKVKQLTDRDKEGLMGFGLFGCYYNVHFIPLSCDGIEMLQLFTIADWHNKLLHYLYDDDSDCEVRDRDTDTFPYNLVSDTAFTMSYLDGNLSRLLRFVAAASDEHSRRGRRMILLCFDHQVDVCKKMIAGLNVELNATSVATVKQIVSEL